METNSTPDDDP